ncbi:MAG: hypothetical protein CSA97_00120 [Bacteroidetes bacterium]|nr:MAG: hypothetical protein CSA97_00120 [Bacteroidota bacterium]
MIQRIQTLWWALALVLLIAFACLPFGRFFGAEGGYSLTVLGLQGDSDGVLVFTAYPLAVIVGLSALLLLGCIFSFKKRLLQVRLSVYAAVFLLGTAGLGVYYTIVADRLLLGGGLALGPLLGLPVLAAVFALLGLRGVKKDIAFLKRMDRLR